MLGDSRDTNVRCACAGALHQIEQFSAAGQAHKVWVCDDFSLHFFTTFFDSQPWRARRRRRPATARRPPTAATWLFRTLGQYRSDVALDAMKTDTNLRHPPHRASHKFVDWMRANFISRNIRVWVDKDRAHFVGADERALGC